LRARIAGRPKLRSELDGLLVWDASDGVIASQRKDCFMGDMSAIVIEFVEEGNQNADLLERHLIELEKNPNSRELLAESFRALHTIKGATSFLGLTKLCALAHAGESLLVRLRDGGLLINQEIASALLALVDAIRAILTEISATGQEGKADYAVLLATLSRLQKSA
jgi:two-component system chemotaxis sensor kinase CheA